MDKKWSIILAALIFCVVAAPAQELTRALPREVKHVLRRGETLYSIARQYGVPLEQIYALNNIADPNTVATGKELLIISAGMASPVKVDSYDITAEPQVARSEDIERPKAIGQYFAQRGDTYYGIARRFGVDVDQLLSFNGLNSSRILKVGQQLMIPASQIDNNGPIAIAGNEASSADERMVSSDSSENISSHRHDFSEESASSANNIVSLRYTANGDHEENFWPLAGRRTTMNGKFPGVMIHGDEGDEIVSVSKGRVIYTGPHSAFGRVVFVQNASGYIYIYGGQRDIDVAVGDVVEMGDTIGSLGFSRNEDSPRLYFSVWLNEQFIEPINSPRG